ncbi:MAG TPA: DNA helicase RecQ, partial [Anaerolineaceae bacterium]
MNPTPETLLKSVFGYDEFRPMQLEVINNVLKKRDTLVIMPTGSGKSLCYQIPALLFPGLTVVVSPLIALMKDQVEALREAGAAALFLNSSLSLEEYNENIRLVQAGKVKLLYVAPETLLTPRLFALLGSVQLDCLTIDEAHCISEWGHDFRPEYRLLVEVRDRFPKAVCMALTATATPRVREDIQASLRFESSNEFIASFDRPNLLIEVTPKTNSLAQTVEFLERFKNQSGIIYCFTRKQVDTLAALLANKGYSVRPYHAGLEDDERRHNQELFIRDDVQIMVATIAFGMGIDKPNVRFILHYDLPKSLEGYYQEIGRAGRDGLTSVCRLLYNYGDAMKLKYFLDEKEEPERTVALKHLQAMTRYAEIDTCRRAPLLAYFGEKYTTLNCGMCDNCQAGAKVQVDITIPAQKFLSCTRRTGERFGAGHVADVLLGSANEKVLKNGHQNLSTYGIGKELTRKQWMHIARQLVQKGLLAEEGEYAVLQLTSKAYEALRNKETILGVLKEKEQAPLKMAGELEYDAALFELLRKKRKELADGENVPPYIIFSDRTLIEMSAFYPMSDVNLKKINGVGTVKAGRYGEVFMSVIRPYCKEHKLAEKIKPTDRASRASLRGALRPAPAKNSPTKYSPTNYSGTYGGAYGGTFAGRTGLKGSRTAEVAEAYNDGETIQKLMELYGVSRSTILDHLANYALGGNALRPGEDLLALSTLRPEMQNAALMAFREMG